MKCLTEEETSFYWPDFSSDCSEDINSLEIEYLIDDQRHDLLQYKRKVPAFNISKNM